MPDAPAVILYRENITDDTKVFLSVYVQLKVLTEAGASMRMWSFRLAARVLRYPNSAVARCKPTVRSSLGKASRPTEIVVRDHGVRVRFKARRRGWQTIQWLPQ